MHASDLEQLLLTIEEETREENELRERLERKIASKSLNIPKKILQEFKTASEILVAPTKSNFGRFIVVTGLDKSGKETQAFNPQRNPKITSIHDYLLNRSYDVLKILLPSYENTFGSLVAAYLGKEEYGAKILGELSEDVAWILWSLDRAQHNLAVGKWLETSTRNVVVSKRWTETNIAYQIANRISNERILTLERNIIKQAYTFVIDVSPEVIFERMRDSGEKPDKYETMEFLIKVRENYKELHHYYPFGRIFYFNGSEDLEKINQKLLQTLNDLGF